MHRGRFTSLLRRLRPAGLLALAALTAGCQALAAPFLMWGPEPTRTILAEYPYLKGERIAVAVWADHETIFEFPNVQLELSSFVARAIEQHVKDVKLVHPREVVDFQNRNRDWDRLPAARIAERLGADRLILIELGQYTTRDPGSEHLLRGHIAAAVRVYTASAGEGVSPAYRTEVSIAHPPDGPGAWGQSETIIRRETMEVFAEELAKKFYDHKVKVR
jgi:hypothetical protein